MAVAIAAAAIVAGRETSAKETPIAVGEVAQPPEGFGVDVAELRNAATDEINELDPAELPARRRVIVSLALTRAVLDGPVDYTVSAMVRDGRTGTMLAVIEADSHAAGTASAELRKQVAGAAVRKAVRRIPNALARK